jgi:hypothetical protein
MESDMESEILYSNYQPEKSLLNLKIGGRSVKLDKTLQQNLLVEWEDLLRHLFPRAHPIVVEPMIPGYSGAGIATVQSFFEQGAGQKVVVKFGDVHQIKEEQWKERRVSISCIPVF